MPGDWDDRYQGRYRNRDQSNEITATTDSSSTYRPDRSPYADPSTRRWYGAPDVAVVPGDRRDRARYPEEPRYYRRDRSATPTETEVLGRPSFAPNTGRGGRSSNVTYQSGLSGRSCHTTYENGHRSRSPHSTAADVAGPKSQYDEPDPRYQPESRFTALEISAGRRRRNDTAYHTSDRPDLVARNRTDVPIGFSPLVTASRSRAIVEDDTVLRAGSRSVVEDDPLRRAGSRFMVEDDTLRRASSRVVVEDIPDRRAGSRFVVEDIPHRSAGSYFVVEEQADRRQGSQFVVDEPPERSPYWTSYTPRWEMESDYVLYPRRRSSMERIAPPEVDRTAPRKQYVVLRDREGEYMGIDRR